MFSTVLYRAYLLLMQKFAQSHTIQDSTLSIQMMMRPSLGYVEIPQRAESRQQEFGYISEDDGQYHATRRIDWDYLLNEEAKHDYKCDVCQRHYQYSSYDLAWEHEHPFMLCGHPWKFLVNF